MIRIAETWAPQQSSIEQGIGQSLEQCDIDELRIVSHDGLCIQIALLVQVDDRVILRRMGTIRVMAHSVSFLVSYTLRRTVGRQGAGKLILQYDVFLEELF